MANTRFTTNANRRVTTQGGVRSALSGRETLFTIAQRVQRYESAATLVNVDQTTGFYTTASAIIDLSQRTRNEVLYQASAAIITVDQTTVMLSQIPAQPLIGIAQEIRRHRPATRLVRLRQMTLATYTAPEPDPGGGEWPGLTIAPPERAVFITLDGVDISEQCGKAFSVNGAEGDNRTAQVVYYPPSGALNITSYQGREIEIDRLQDGQLVSLFRGVVDVPTYDRFRRVLVLRCSDLRNERVGDEEKDALKSMTGGIYSDITQRDDAQGEAWVRELMKTVPGSLDYTSDGVLRYRPWEVAAPRFTLEAADIHHRDISMEFATRSEIVNTVRATIEYRYYQRNTATRTVSVSVPTSNVCRSSDGCLPSGQMMKRSMIEQAVKGVGWFNTSLSFTPAPSSGWYRGSASVNSPGGERVAFIINDIVRATYAMGFSAGFSKHISQPKREVYDLTFTAPESTDQFGAIASNNMRFAVETRVDPAIYEERGCVIVANADDRRGDLNHAMECAGRMARKEILAGHRQNYASVRYKPGKGRSGNGQLLPVEIGDTLQVNADEIIVTGWVTEFSHQQGKHGDLWTDVKLAVSRVDSNASVTEDWALPNPPLTYYLAPPPEGQLSTPQCPAPEGDIAAAQETGFIDGRLTITTPKIPRNYVDEITGVREAEYQVKIPVNPFDVSVP